MNNRFIFEISKTNLTPKPMKSYLLLIVLMILPIFAFSQYNNNHQLEQSRSFERQRTANNQKLSNDIAKSDRDWATRARMNRLMNKSAAEDKKITIQENNKKKLEEKTAKLETDLKIQKEKLAILEKSDNSQDSSAKKNVEKTKEQISKTEEKLSKAKTELETSSKKLEDLKKGKEISLTKQSDLEKKEKEENERKQKQDEINKALLKNLKTN